MPTMSPGQSPNTVVFADEGEGDAYMCGDNNGSRREEYVTNQWQQAGGESWNSPNGRLYRR